MVGIEYPSESLENDEEITITVTFCAFIKANVVQHLGFDIPDDEQLDSITNETQVIALNKKSVFKIKITSIIQIPEDEQPNLPPTFNVRNNRLLFGDIIEIYSEQSVVSVGTQVFLSFDEVLSII